MIKLSCTTIFLLTSLISFSPQKKNQNNTGLFVFHYLAKGKINDKFSEIKPPDTVYYNNDFGIESMLRTESKQNPQGEITNKIEQNGYNLIDISNKRFCKFSSLSELERSSKDKWLSIDQKKIGIKFDYPFYSNEKFIEKDTIIDNRSFRLIRYISNETRTKGAFITLYIEPGKSSPLPFYSIQPTFSGRLHQIFIVPPAQYEQLGETMLRFDYHDIPTNSPVLGILKGLKKENT
ncbi:hypothetical protein DVR12_13860 [Chitinophaga silvatica]|uniref:Uncharacterized protein n=1 Tax=Chitinophaga silvatica TaxID=2282649 RepID=A0A3E1Y8K6_9BACT|nr:hypothetical protein [Chitinophaga silvatica]RFS21742.1 hypothetical protein DVR12_13860 [Chitinophaga silvatica]